MLDRTTAPPRPPLASAVPAPAPPPAGPPPGAVRWAAGAWVVAVVAGATAVVSAGLRLDAVRADLLATATAQDPQAPAAVLRSSVTTALLLPAGALALGLVVGSGTLVALLGRRPWSRWVTGVLAAAAAGGAAIAAGLLGGGPVLDEAGLATASVALAAVVVLVWTRPVGRWLAVGR